MLFILKSKKRLPPNAEKTIRILAGKLRKRKIDSKTISLENLEVFLDGNGAVMKLKNWTPSKHSSIYFRIVEKYKNASYIFSKYLETKKIPFIDQYHTSTRERNKLIQMFLLAINGVSIPKTYYTPVYDAKKARNAARFLRFPIVVKLTNKERGEGVFLARDMKGLARILEKNKEQEIILQEFLDNDFDYRIVVLGHKTQLGETRTRTCKNEFRNNACKGGVEKFFPAKEVSCDLRKISEQSSRIMNIQVCGADIIRSRKGKLYVIEVNFSPGFTLDEKISDEVNQLAIYIKKWYDEKR
jgi:RimK family alpha-L-glutamate ligase